MNNMKEDENKVTNIKIGVYAITGYGILSYLFWMGLEDAYTFAFFTFMINLIWYTYSRRLLYIDADKSDYTKNYTINYLICVFGCLAMYNFDIPMLYRNICIFFLGCEGFCRTFFVEIRILIKESKV